MNRLRARNPRNRYGTHHSSGLRTANQDQRKREVNATKKYRKNANGAGGWEDGAACFAAHGDFAEGGQVPAYDVSPDGQHFYFLHANAQPQGNIKIVLNWSEELKRLAPGGRNH